MLEKHINKVIDYSNSLIQENEFYFLKDIEQIKKLPNFIFRYLNNFVSQKIQNDANKIKNIPYYDFTDENSFDILYKFEENLKERFYLSREQLKLIISDLIRLHFNYLVRPRNTILFNFKDNTEININDIVLKLSYFSNYSYLINGVLHELNDLILNKEKITHDELTSLIEKIDNEYIFGKTAKDFISLLDSLYGLFELYDEENNERLAPIEALMIFFDDKSLLPIVELLDQKFQSEKLYFVSEKVLLDILIEVIDSISDNSNEGYADIDNSEIYTAGLNNFELDNSENIEIENLDKTISEEKDVDNLIQDEFLKDVDIDAGKIDANDLSAYGFDLSDFEDLEEDLSNNKEEVIEEVEDLSETDVFSENTRSVDVNIYSTEDSYDNDGHNKEEYDNEEISSELSDLKNTLNIDNSSLDLENLDFDNIDLSEYGFSSEDSLDNNLDDLENLINK